ncbi:MAG: hypothetical protein ACJ790_13750 [Myxococcaceae bacterium]
MRHFHKLVGVSVCALVALSGCKSFRRSVRGGVNAEELKTIQLLPSRFCGNSGADLQLLATDSDGDPIKSAEENADFFDNAVEFRSEYGRVQAMQFQIAEPFSHIDQAVKISANIKGRPDTLTEITLQPDYTCDVHIDLAGRSGRNGESGRNGQDGTQATQPGGVGQMGGSGGDGQNAPPVDIDLYTISTPQHPTLAVVYARWSGTSDGQYAIYDPTKVVANVVARGGDGGNGGSGGHGGRGGHGEQCRGAGLGGAGAQGGQGGAGGAGPRVVVRYDKTQGELLTRSLKVSNPGGHGGSAGYGGNGGTGGDGAYCADQMTDHGANGQNGQPGYEGAPGQAGPPPNWRGLNPSELTHVGPATAPNPPNAQGGNL